MYDKHLWTKSTHNHSTSWIWYIISNKYSAYREFSPLPWGVRQSGQSAPGRSRRCPAAPGCSQSDPRAWTPSRNAQVHGTVTGSPVNVLTFAGYGEIRWKKRIIFNTQSKTNLPYMITPVIMVCTYTGFVWSIESGTFST